MKKIPLGIQSFRKIIEGGYVYVDKTQYIYKLLNGASYNFISRPRRFGKSLLLDAIKEALSGNVELFKGLWIYDSGYAFEKHPVIRFDMSNIPNKSPDILNASLVEEIHHQAKKEGIELFGASPAICLKRLIEGLHEKHG